MAVASMMVILWIEAEYAGWRVRKYAVVLPMMPPPTIQLRQPVSPEHNTKKRSFLFICGPFEISRTYYHSPTMTILRGVDGDRGVCEAMVSGSLAGWHDESVC